MRTFSGHSNATKSLGTSIDKNFLVSVFFFMILPGCLRS